MPPVIRPARAEELQSAEELVVQSINDLTERHGFGRMAAVRPADFQMYSLRDDPGGVWVAEKDGQIAGFALSWVCGDLWFLAELFVAPGAQGNGVGQALLSRAFEHASQAGATNKSLITFAFNVVSQGLYIQHGLLPRLPLYLVGGTYSPGRRMQQHKLRSAPIGSTDLDIATLEKLDVGTLGISREKHHRYLLDNPAMKGVLLHDAGGVVGYAYISATGHIGPLAVTQPKLMTPALRTAMDLVAAGGATQLSAYLPGVGDALRFSLDNGMRIKTPMMLMAEREFGDWSRYVPRAPGFM